MPTGDSFVKDFLLIHRAKGGLSDDDLRQFLTPKLAAVVGVAHHEATWSAVAFGAGAGAEVMWAMNGAGGAGVAALDNAAQLAATGKYCGVPLADAELALNHLATVGADSIKAVLGAFGLAYVDHGGQRVTLARDAIGVAPIYYRFLGDVLAVSSSATALSLNCEVDREYVAEYLVRGTNPEGRTIYNGVRAIPAGTYARRAHDRLQLVKFWSTRDFAPDYETDANNASREFRQLLDTAVAACIGGDQETWSELSGGVDSSSIVSVAATLKRRDPFSVGLRGTLSMVDELGWGDERQFSRAVAEHHNVRNVEVTMPRPFVDGERPLQLADTPSRGFAWAYDAEPVKQTLRDLGCSRVLSGLGPDHYLRTSLVHAADLIAIGRLGSAAKDILAWSVATRSSFWHNLSRRCVVPLMTQRARQRSRVANRSVPRWIESDFAVEFDLRGRTEPVRRYSGRWGHKRDSFIAFDFMDLEQQLHPSSVFNTPHTRYPFLYRPLVEYALRLPHYMRARPHQNKLVMRRALGDDLPSIVRTRSGKGRVGTRAVWALTHNGGVVDQLLTDPLLADFGFINPRQLRRSIERARRGELGNWVDAITTLSLELWLRVRGNRWQSPRVSSPLPVVEIN